MAYTSDLEQSLALLTEAARDVGRVLQEPAPTPYLAGFGSDGINLELGFWIEDAATGTAGVRSTVNRNIWRRFAEHGISIPYAQREVRIVPPGDFLRGVGNAADAPAAATVKTTDAIDGPADGKAPRAS